MGRQRVAAALNAAGAGPPLAGFLGHEADHALYFGLVLVGHDAGHRVPPPEVVGTAGGHDEARACAEQCNAEQCNKAADVMTAIEHGFGLSHGPSGVGAKGAQLIRAGSHQTAWSVRCPVGG